MYFNIAQFHDFNTVENGIVEPDLDPSGSEIIFHNGIRIRNVMKF
jgi:hypothetical protein